MKIPVKYCWIAVLANYFRMGWRRIGAWWAPSCATQRRVWLSLWKAMVTPLFARASAHWDFGWWERWTLRPIAISVRAGQQRQWGRRQGLFFVECCYLGLLFWPWSRRRTDDCFMVHVLSAVSESCHRIRNHDSTTSWTCTRRNVTLKETTLVRWFVFLCASVEEWRTQNEWLVRCTHTSETSVSRALPQVFSSTLEHIRSRTQTISRVWFRVWTHWAWFQCHNVIRNCSTQNATNKSTILQN